MSNSEYAEFYGDDLKAKLLEDSRDPPEDYLCKAADILYNTLADEDVEFAFVGGWAVYLRGGTRKPNGVDV